MPEAFIIDAVRTRWAAAVAGPASRPVGIDCHQVRRTQGRRTR